jgi:hypothetical protein
MGRDIQTRLSGVSNLKLIDTTDKLLLVSANPRA